MTQVAASVILLTFNQEAFVKDALQSLLDQDYACLEIVVSDDASDDATWSLINQIAENYAGEKRIILNRNEVNLGIVGNYFKAFGFTTGEVVFTTAGDDVSLNNRCSSCINKWLDSNTNVDLIATDGYDMLLDGEVVGIKYTDELSRWSFNMWTLKRPFVFGASHMMTRRLLTLRPLDPNLPVEDQNLVARALLMGGALRLPVPLVKHRRGGVSQSKKKLTYSEKKLKLINSARFSLIERLEIINDAAMLGLKVESNLDRQFKLANYMIAILEEASFFKRLLILVLSTGVPLVKKLRFFQFAAFPRINANLMRWKI